LFFKAKFSEFALVFFYLEFDQALIFYLRFSLDTLLLLLNYGSIFVSPLSQEFRILMSESSDMRMKLERAIKNCGKSMKAAEAAKLAQNNTQLSAPASTIKLKTDFSNFSSSS